MTKEQQIEILNEQINKLNETVYQLVELLNELEKDPIEPERSQAV